MQSGNDEYRSLLTEKEAEILQMVALGFSDLDIAEALDMSHPSVKVNLDNIYRKIDAPNRLQAALWAVRYL
jgi:DNA-binding CsgD family transcriptional regulator